MERIGVNRALFFAMTIDTLDTLFKEELKDLYDAEKQLVRALPKMAKAASDPELKEAFKEHLEQTKGHVARLEEVFGLLDMKPKGKPCAAMKGLVEEGSETAQENATEQLLDIMLITAAQKVEHYEISGYGTLRTIAQQLEHEDIVELLQATEDEEKETDSNLTVICERILSEVEPEGEEDEEEEGEEDEPLTPVAKPAMKKATTRKR
jgi:ferritin-like metal-binding protein YciE